MVEGDASQHKAVTDALRREVAELRAQLLEEKHATRKVKTKALKLEKATRILDPNKAPMEGLTHQEEASGKPKRAVRRGHSRTRSGSKLADVMSTSESNLLEGNDGGNLMVEFARVDQKRTAEMVDAAYAFADKMRHAKHDRDAPRRMPIHEALHSIAELEEALKETKAKRAELQEVCKKDILRLNELHSQIQDLEAILKDNGDGSVDKVSGYSKAKRLFEKCLSHRTKIDEIWGVPGRNREERLKIREENQRFIKDVADKLTARSFTAEEYIVRAGEDGDCMYFIAIGTAAIKLSTGKQFIEREGAFIGEIALMTECKRTADVVALTDVHALVFTRNDCLEVLGQYPEKEAEFFAIGQARLRRDAAMNAATPEERKKMKTENIPMPTWIQQAVSQKFIDDKDDLTAAAAKTDAARAEFEMRTRLYDRRGSYAPPPASMGGDEGGGGAEDGGDGNTDAEDGEGDEGDDGAEGDEGDDSADGGDGHGVGK